jgi:hypothetical protein
MELSTVIPRRGLGGELSKRAACREYHVDWDTLEKALAYVELTDYRRNRPKIDALLPTIEAILQADQKVH